MDGRPIAARPRISPPTYMPISRTAASCSGPRRRTVSGRPTSLFWLPSVRRVRKRRPSTAATASLVDVFAMLPVMPTTIGVNRVRQAAATACRAARVSGTSTRVTSPSVPWAGSPAAGSGPRETRMAAAPAAAAAARNRWPSVRSPGRATNRLPGATRRESTAAPRIRRSLRRSSRPAVAASRPSAVRAGSGAGGRPGSVTPSSVAWAALTGGPRRRASRACRGPGRAC